MKLKYAFVLIFTTDLIFQKLIENAIFDNYLHFSNHIDN